MKPFVNRLIFRVQLQFFLISHSSPQLVYITEHHIFVTAFLFPQIPPARLMPRFPPFSQGGLFSSFPLSPFPVLHASTGLHNGKHLSSYARVGFLHLRHIKFRCSSHHSGMINRSFSAISTSSVNYGWHPLKEKAFSFPQIQYICSMFFTPRLVYITESIIFSPPLSCSLKSPLPGWCRAFPPLVKGGFSLLFTFLRSMFFTPQLVYITESVCPPEETVYVKLSV